MRTICLLLFIACRFPAIAQQSAPIPVTDSLPAMYQGLQAGYSITGASEKEVGNKGNFSRYKLRFFITNTAPEAKLLMQTPGFLFKVGSVSPEIVQFKCTNATGARFTNKEATLRLQPCNIEATVDDKECGTEKVVQNRRTVNIGYWIKPGETVAANTIMIVPLNEKPVVTATFYPNNRSAVGTPLSFPGDNGTGAPAFPGFVRIKNFAANTYLHNQDGPVKCTAIDFGWWSAQWEIVPVSGTAYVQIRNRWKNNFVSTDNGNLLSDNGQSANAMWMMEATAVDNVYYIRNVADNSRLIYQNGMLRAAVTYVTDASVQWIIEKQ